ncbi:MAG: hypothetical protein JSV91_08450 [Phycisphaerales bacterium]|nr:MAG: hypothetical protein JSV91_08450 [Phycisphaerales bacterium]
MYLDQSSYEAALLTSTVVDFEGVPFGELIVRPAGYSWDGLVAGIMMYQIDAERPGYYGAPYLSDFIASTMYDKPVLFELPPGTNAIGGQWFHAQIPEYDGHFTLTLADNSTFEYIYTNIATGRELNEPDFCGFICADQDIVSINFHAEREGVSCVSLADNIEFGHGTPIVPTYKDWNPNSAFYAGGYSPGAIVADDVQVAPGGEGERITAVSVELMNMDAGGADFQLYVYDDDPSSGLPDTLLGSTFLTHLEYSEREMVTVELTDVFVPDDGFMWVGVQASASDSGWVIADQPAEIGSSDDVYALDDGSGFGYQTFRNDLIANMQLVVGVPASCPADVNGDGVVNIDDVFDILGAWGPCDDCPEDVNGDGTVNIDDLFAILGAWGPCP